MIMNVTRQTAMSGFCRSAFVSLAILFAATAGAAAQTQPMAPEATAPALELSAAQKQTIYQSVSSRSQKNNAAPPGFRAAVGMHVPETIELVAMPDTLATVIPAVKGYEVAMVEKQVVVVDPKSKVVVAVVTQE
jgi:hypothetical protein